MDFKIILSFKMQNKLMNMFDNKKVFNIQFLDNLKI